MGGWLPRAGGHLREEVLPRGREVSRKGDRQQGDPRQPRMLPRQPSALLPVTRQLTQLPVALAVLPVQPPQLLHCGPVPRRQRLVRQLQHARLVPALPAQPVVAPLVLSHDLWGGWGGGVGAGQDV